MTFKKAYQIAMEKSASFRAHDARVREAQENGTSTPCMIFTVAVGETFYYGFDGVDLHAGKHTRARAARLLDNDEALIIL
jgi:hypothetical protein